MLTTRARWFAMVTLLAATPALQGAGCRSHYSARLQGQVRPSETHRKTHRGKAALVVYRIRSPGMAPCNADKAACAKAGPWLALHACDAIAEGKTPSALVDDNAEAIAFDACTSMVGIDYEADVIAFVDGNGNGQLDSGEPFGVYETNPLTRAKDNAPLVIVIDETLP